ncbi:hypothetical protein LEP1GSC041_1329 [Leptospira noguchii str. 2006001870]|uniref:Uncharacterized protein n=1 Tax=Leptospira noguchii serovar Autumnalis str. ZUN142 TaxID=1085540 RepID=M6UGN1_9LEPT|nr:hypothetical protein LEP1GSC041_1329 [Leptospira noguchii str. 2006001870]EMO40249.1 hypothetical protein LEP1GSC186_3973 [Leptospira noguchii serovar Autumnalis str. ZUN142]EMS87459.1 hypothetical protein LEP1GSC073_1689 [Leptospira noguchii str. Cascata]
MEFFNNSNNLFRVKDLVVKNFVPNQMQLSPKLKVLFFDENEYNSSKQNLFPGYNNDKIEILFSFLN